MKATPSCDGEPRFTVSVQFRIGREDLINAILYWIGRYGGQPPESRRQAVEYLRRSLHETGVGIFVADDECLSPEEKRLVQQLVTHHFPDLNPSTKNKP